MIAPKKQVQGDTFPFQYFIKVKRPVKSLAAGIWQLLMAVGKGLICLKVTELYLKGPEDGSPKPRGQQACALPETPQGQSRWLLPLRR